LRGGNGNWVVFRPEVGEVGERSELPFAFERILGPPSDLFSVTLPRPMGIVFEMDTAGLVRVVELVKDSQAAQGAAIARLGSGPAGGNVLVGDVLRAVTSTTMSARKPQENPRA